MCDHCRIDGARKLTSDHARSIVNHQSRTIRFASFFWSLGNEDTESRWTETGLRDSSECHARVSRDGSREESS